MYRTMEQRINKMKKDLEESRPKPLRFREKHFKVRSDVFPYREISSDCVTIPMCFREDQWIIHSFRNGEKPGMEIFIIDNYANIYVLQHGPDKSFLRYYNENPVEIWPLVEKMPCLPKRNTKQSLTEAKIREIEENVCDIRTMLQIVTK